jgi:hypothetical protein
MSAFDGYPNLSSSDYFITLSVSPITLDTNQQSILIRTTVSCCFYNWMNYLSYTYIMVDLTSFLHTPIIQQQINVWIPL